MKDAGISQKLCCITFDHPDAVCLGKEPILNRQGKKIGYVTSADYGYSVGKFILYWYLPLDYATAGTQVQVHILTGDTRLRSLKNRYLILR